MHTLREALERELEKQLEPPIVGPEPGSISLEELRHSEGVVPKNNARGYTTIKHLRIFSLIRGNGTQECRECPYGRSECPGGDNCLLFGASN